MLVFTRPIFVTTSAAQFFAFFAKTKDGRAKDFSRKMRCEKCAKNCPKHGLKLPQNSPLLLNLYCTWISIYLSSTFDFLLNWNSDAKNASIMTNSRFLREINEKRTKYNKIITTCIYNFSWNGNTMLWQVWLHWKKSTFLQKFCEINTFTNI